MLLLLLITLVVSDSVRPHRRQPTRLRHPWILQARTLEWVAIPFSNAWKWKVKVKLLSRVQLWATPRTAAYQAPPSMGFSRQEYWSGVPVPSYSKFKCCFLKLSRFFFPEYFLPNVGGGIQRSRGSTVCISCTTLECSNNFFHYFK